MSKTGISPALLAHYQGGSTTIAKLWKLVRSDALVFGFTDHDEDVLYPIVGPVTYKARTAFDASAVKTTGDLSVDDLEAIGVLDDEGITAHDLESGLWDGATFELVEVNYRDLTMGHNDIQSGELGKVSRGRGNYKAEARGLMAKLQNNIVRIVTSSCDADLGDARCKVDLEALRQTGAVTVATSKRQFTASGLVGATGYFDFGVVTFTTGLNAGQSMEVKQQTAAVLQLQLDMAELFTIGDAFTIVPGCDKTKATCVGKYDNLLNRRAFDFVPGQDAVLAIGGQ